MIERPAVDTVAAPQHLRDLKGEKTMLLVVSDELDRAEAAHRAMHDIDSAGGGHATVGERPMRMQSRGNGCVVRRGAVPGIDRAQKRVGLIRVLRARIRSGSRAQ